ncbi:cell wall protein [Aspergillus sp. HF37]|nr:cell wall protein [Aspergillus sp. HF37]
MLFTKSAFLLSFLALCNLVAAVPPACLLDVMGGQKHPGDLKTICGDNAGKVKSQITDTCGSHEKAAMKYYASKCSSAGFKVDTATTTTSGTSATGTGNSAKSSSTNTGFVTATTSGSSSTSTSTNSGGSGSGSNSDSGSGSGSGSDSGSNSGSDSGSSTSSSPSATPTANSGPSDRHVSAAAFAAVVFVGFAATL